MLKPKAYKVYDQIVTLVTKSRLKKYHNKKKMTHDTS